MNKGQRSNVLFSQLSWLQSIQAILFRNGFGNIYDQTIQRDRHEVKRKVLKRLEDQFIQVWYRKVNCQAFGVKPNMVKQTYEMSSYLIDVKNPEVRTVFTRLRCGYNILHSSIGRYKNGGSKNCTSCKNEVESVEHFLFDCPKFSNIRNDLLNVIKQYVPNFDNLSSESKLGVILDFNVPNRMKDLLRNSICKFVSTMYNARKHDS